MNSRFRLSSILCAVLALSAVPFVNAQAPTITTQPEGQTLSSGSTVVFTVVATGSPTYQWQLNGVNLTNSSSGVTTDIIAGATGPQLEISNTSTASDGNYTCVVTNGSNNVTSSQAALSVVTGVTTGYLINISVRAQVMTGANILIGGFYVVGSTSRTVLIQGLGPALAGEGVSGVLNFPALTIHDSTGATIYSNTGWGSSQVLLNAAASAYATPVLAANSNDSELLLTLPPGGYTAEIAGADGGTGVALCAIYQFP
jgi:hypothetical protein